MYEPNVQKVMGAIAPTDRVLDIGGWARPFNRSNVVIDAEPFDTRGYYGAALPAQGGPTEQFNREGWIQRDLCERTPYPFPDKFFDFVICSHTLEDLRDPLWVCSEIVRIGKRGYIEVPSRVAETCRGMEQGQVGWSHHRWLIDIKGTSMFFLMKYHRIHAQRRFSFPASFLHALPEEKKVQWFFWEGSFHFAERTIHGVDAIEQELDGFVAGIRPYPAWQRTAERSLLQLSALKQRFMNRLRRFRG